MFREGKLYKERIIQKQVDERYLIKKTVNAFKCLRCDHEWIPRVSMHELEVTVKEKPRICPGCKSAYWDMERKNSGQQDTTHKNGKKSSKRGEHK